MATHVETNFVNTWLSGSTVAPVLASPATGDVVIAGFGPNNDEPTTTATIGGEDMTLLHFDEDAGWAFFYRVLDGAEADGTCAFETNGSAVTSAYGFVQQWTDCNGVGFDSFDGIINLYGGLTLPQTFQVPLADTDLSADSVALAMFVSAANGSGNITFATPTSFTSRGSQQEASGTDRSKGHLFTQAGAATLADPVESAMSKSTGGDITSFTDWAFVLQVTFTEAAAGHNPAQDNTDFFFPYERLAVTAKELPFYMDTGLLKGIFDE